MISSNAPPPTSLTWILPVPGCTLKLNGLRKPRAQISPRAPDVPTNGLSAGMMDFGKMVTLSRSIFPDTAVCVDAGDHVACLQPALVRGRVGKHLADAALIAL